MAAILSGPQCVHPEGCGSNFQTHLTIDMLIPLVEFPSGDSLTDAGKSTLGKVMAWCHSEQMLTKLYDAVCHHQGQWVNIYCID